MLLLVLFNFVIGGCYILMLQKLLHDFYICAMACKRSINQFLNWKSSAMINSTEGVGGDVEQLGLAACKKNKPCLRINRQIWSH